MPIDGLIILEPNGWVRLTFVVLEKLPLIFLCLVIKAIQLSKQTSRPLLLPILSYTSTRLIMQSQDLLTAGLIQSSMSQHIKVLQLVVMWNVADWGYCAQLAAMVSSYLPDVRMALRDIYQVDPVFVFAFLQTFVDTLQDYLVEISTSSLRDHFDVVYQVSNQVGLVVCSVLISWYYASSSRKCLTAAMSSRPSEVPWKTSSSPRHYSLRYYPQLACLD